MSKGKIVLAATQKGGTGKSTSVLSIAHAMAYYFDKKVAVVDSDEQATALSFYSQRKITANEPELEGISMAFPEVAKITEASPYRKQIDRIKEFYDVIIVDTKGEFKQFQHDLIRMSDFVLVPVQASEFDTEPTKLVSDAVAHENAQRDDDEKVGIAYIMNKVNTQANSTKFIARIIKEDIGGEVIEPPIPVLDVIPSAAALGFTVIDIANFPTQAKKIINKRREEGEKASIDKAQSSEIAKIYKIIAEAILKKLELA